MPRDIRYIHTNLVANDWRRLASFYERVLGCTMVPPERDYKEEWLERVTGLEGAALQGAHLRLPGHGEDGPTLEIFQYSDPAEGRDRVVNRPGFAHIAFMVGDLAALRDRVLEEGGAVVGETIALDLPGGNTVQIVYLTDPEGNVIELQQRL